MKLFLPSGVIIIFLTVAALRAQDAPLPKPDAQKPAESGASVTPTPLPIKPPQPLLPPDLPPASKPTPFPVPDVPSIPEIDEGFKRKPLSSAYETQRKHLEWRRLRNAAQNESILKAALAKAEAARTDLEKRKLLGRYYDLLYDKLIARAGAEMRGYLEARKQDALRDLPQPRVRPDLEVSKSQKHLDPSDLSGPSDSPSPSPDLN